MPRVASQRFHGLPTLAKLAVRLGRQLGPRLRLGQASEDLPRRLVARLVDHLRELPIELAVDPEPPVLLPAVGGHQIDELDHARRVGRHVAVIVGEPGRLAMREVEQRYPDLRLAQPSVAGQRRGHRAVEEIADISGLSRARVI